MSADAEQFLRKDAERNGMTFNEYCKQWGLVGPSQERQHRRHEVPLETGN